ncbi:hypothetical protein [Bradyrhizobium sp. 30]|uniref:hypothetical protein n=1 Tax=Bradyrhizobium sp. 30 TaxID=2782669 RepID=UPI001FF87ECA|nr:hypothetical protein [Bradyrhizobium sp. 30]
MAGPQTEELYDDVSASVLRALSGFLMSVALIVPLGLGVGWCAQLRNLKQFTEICQNTASLAVLPDLHPVSGHSRALKITM